MDEQLTNFQDHVSLKYSLYNSLFLTLPFREIQQAGTLLILFAKYSSLAIKKGLHPQQIVNHFFKKNTDIAIMHDDDKINVLFTILHFVERQIVLFDALEDAGFTATHDLAGPGSLANLAHKIIGGKAQANFVSQMADYRIKITLTAHPTQFYPPPILGIITQLTTAIQNNNLKEIRDLLWQMGKTSFKYQQKPTPYQEALSLTWYVENIFYAVIPDIQQQINNLLSKHNANYTLTHPVIELGFWPGGDRDGNPNITSQVTLAVAKLLKTKILKLYNGDLRALVRKLTFKGILESLHRIKNKLEETYLLAELGGKPTTATYLNAEELIEDLTVLRTTLIADHNGLFLEYLDKMITKVQCFGFCLAAIDMRENAPIHRQVFELLLKDLAKQNKKLIASARFTEYLQLNFSEKLSVLEKILTAKWRYVPSLPSQYDFFDRTVASMAVIKEIQKTNGEKSLCRYIISNTQTSLDVLELLAMLRLVGGFGAQIPLDIIPLFENIEDLENSEKIMEELYQFKLYQQHLTHRNNTQTIMLGFSDGTKDGGYVTANWSIYKAKINLTKISEQYNIKVIFFDGRGGPPARGGGNTHHFYRSLGSKIRHRDLQLTIQGQTVSSNFGTYASAKFNIEQLFTAGIDDLIFPHHANNINAKEAEILQQLSAASYQTYNALKKDELFVPYLEEMTPLKFYGELNIGSRPVARKKNAKLQFTDLRAIPFVGSWSQLKQNIPGYYGFGSALKTLIKSGKEQQLIKLYQDSLFFRTLVENTMMSLSKTFFPLTQYMRNDKKFGKFWQQLYKEAKLTEHLLLKISGQKILLEKDPQIRASIKLREQIVLPLLIIQQFAMIEIKDLEENSRLFSIYKQMILKALAANTNASRNSA